MSIKNPTHEELLEYALEGLSMNIGTQSGNPEAATDIMIWEHHRSVLTRKLELHRRQLLAKEQRK